MTDLQTTVHHAIIEMHEVHDYEDITLHAIMDYTDLSYRQVMEAVDGLVLKGIAKINDQFEVIECDNQGYFPTTLVSREL